MLGLYKIQIQFLEFLMKIVISHPFVSDFYLRMHKEIINDCLEDNKYKIYKECFFENDIALKDYLKKNNIDLLIKMNKTFSMRNFDWNKSKHVAWMVDMGNLRYVDLNKSDNISFFGYNWHLGYKENTGNESIWIPPGVFVKNKLISNSLFPEFNRNLIFTGHYTNFFNKKEKNK